MATTNYLLFNPSELNTESDANYIVDPTRLGGAQSGGILPSTLFNKVIFQQSEFTTAFATMMVNKGYSSQSALYSSSKRFLEASDEGKDLILFYLGDHDPSGEDMVRDIQTRLGMFGAELEVRKLALTMPQIDKYKPPPNPTKLTDSRAAAYVEKFGNSSWEVDALPPNVLARLIRTELDALVDRERMDVIIGREEKDKAYLRRAVASYRKEEDDT